MNPPVIRLAERRDRAAVFAWAVGLATSARPTREAFDRSFDAVLAADDAQLLVAENDEGVCGYVLGFRHPAFFADGQVGWVEEIIVAPEHRRDGVGRALMEEFEAWARASNIRLVALATRRASTFHTALGYEESATYVRKLL